MAEVDGVATSGDWLRPVLDLEDPVGVLSVYLDADPVLAGGTPPAWQTPVRAGLRDLLKEAQLEWPRAERMVLEARLEELEPELGAWLERRDLSRGRALFAAVERGEVQRVAIHAELPSMVDFGPRARVLPLLAARQAGRPAGVVELSWASVVLSEWEFGVLRDVEKVDLDVALGGAHEPPATNPAVPQPFPERDRFETRVGSRVLARIREFGGELRQEAEARGWDVVVVDGDSQFRDSLVSGLGPSGPVVLASAQPLAGGSPSEAAARVDAVLRERRLDDQRRLVEQLDGAAATRDATVVERALEEGRVEHLLLGKAADPAGFGPAEALLRRALETGARVTVVETGSAGIGPGGAAALLRW